MIPVFVSIVILLASVVQIRWAYQRQQRALSSLHWPSVTATVVESEVIKARPHHDENDHLRFTYYFLLGDTRISAHSITLFKQELRMDAVAMDAFVKVHPVGSVVAVQYNPAQPQECGLACQEMDGYSAWCNLGLLFFGIGCCSLYFAVFAG